MTQTDTRNRNDALVNLMLCHEAPERFKAVSDARRAGLLIEGTSRLKPEYAALWKQFTQQLEKGLKVLSQQELNRLRADSGTEPTTDPAMAELYRRIKDA